MHRHFSSYRKKKIVKFVIYGSALLAKIQVFQFRGQFQSFDKRSLPEYLHSFYQLYSDSNCCLDSALVFQSNWRLWRHLLYWWAKTLTNKQNHWGIILGKFYKKCPCSFVGLTRTDTYTDRHTHRRIHRQPTNIDIQTRIFG